MIKYFKPNLDDLEKNEVTKVIDSGWLTTGKIAAQFELNFLKHFDLSSSYACGVNSNTSGLQLCIESFGFKKGSEIIVPSMTYTASAGAILAAGMIPKIVDANDDNLLDANIIENNLSEDTVAVMVVHFAGKTCDINPIISLCKSKGLKIIEDCAHALPSKYPDGDWVGSKGNPCVFSFYANKTLTTGEGGMIITSDEEFYRKLVMKRNHGIDRNVFDRFSGNSKKWDYDVVTNGFKFNLPDLNAAIGLVQLDKLNEGQVKREKIANLYRSILAKTNLDFTSEANDKGQHAYHLFQIISKNGDKSFKQNIFNQFEKNEVGYSVHYKPLHLMKFWKKFSKQQYPNAEFHFNHSVSLPIYPSLSSDNVEEICNLILEIPNLF